MAIRLFTVLLSVWYGNTAYAVSLSLYWQYDVTSFCYQYGMALQLIAVLLLNVGGNTTSAVLLSMCYLRYLQMAAIAFTWLIIFTILVRQGVKSSRLSLIRLVSTNRYIHSKITLAIIVTIIHVNPMIDAWSCSSLHLNPSMKYTIDEINAAFDIVTMYLTIVSIEWMYIAFVLWVFFVSGEFLGVTYRFFRQAENPRPGPACLAVSRGSAAAAGDLVMLWRCIRVHL